MYERKKVKQSSQNLSAAKTQEKKSGQVPGITLTAHEGFGERVTQRRPGTRERSRR